MDSDDGMMKKLVGMMLLAAIVLVGAANANSEQEVGACIGSTSDVPGATNPCICSKNCACAGKCILNAVDGDDVKTCFVDCVLKNDCRPCRGPLLPATLEKILKLNVTRPIVPRGDRDPQEMLVIGVNVHPIGTRNAMAMEFEVYVNVPDGVKVNSKSPHYVDVRSFVVARGKNSSEVLRVPAISSALSRIGAAGDKTVDVSIVPVFGCEGITIVSVKIE